MQPLPFGVAGNVFIGGPSIGRGYLRDREKTAAKFVQNPLAGAPRESAEARALRLELVAPTAAERAAAVRAIVAADARAGHYATPLADAVMALIAEADEKMAAIGDATAAEAKLPQYVEMFGVYNEALALVEKISSTAAAKGQVKGEQQVVRLKLLEAFVKDLKLRRMMERTFLLFRSENETGQRAVSALFVA